MRKITTNRRAQRLLAVFLAALLIFSLGAPALAIQTAPLAIENHITPSGTPGGEIVPASSLLTTSERIVDPDTSANMGWLDIPRIQDGRIWTDKSINLGTADDEFNITLSALSQSFPVTSGYAIPADTVFVIDVSGSMSSNADINGRTRIAVLVDALNQAIGILLDANPNNRISVVAFGTNVQTILSLGRYTPRNGTFFHMSGTSTVMIDAVAVPGSGATAPAASFPVGGSTPTQWGIYAGAQILENADTTISVPETDATGTVTGTVTVTRRPNMILMTDGEPTQGWSDPFFTTAPSAANRNLGSGSTGEMGIALLTVLTASHRKQLVQDHYFPGGWNLGTDIPANQPAPSVGFYTIGLGGQAATSPLIPAAMFPFDPNNTAALGYADAVPPSYPTGATSPTMGALLRELADGQPISFYAHNTGGTYITVNVSPPAGITLGLQQLAFATAYFPATDTQSLQDAFTSITTGIQQQSIETVTNIDPIESPDFSGWLVFSDVLGEYMQFRDGLSLSFDGTTYSRAGFDLTNATVLSSYQTILYNHLNYDITSADPFYVDQATVNALLASNIADGNTTSIFYYADVNRNFLGYTDPGDAAALVEVFPMTGTLGTPIVTGGQTNLMYITFHVVTALQDGTFAEILNPPVGTAGAQVLTSRALAAGDQLVRWYIPASLIPMRTVDPDTGAVSGNTLPVQVTYTVGLDQTRILAGLSAAYISANTAPDGSIYFYSNRWHNNQNVTLAFYEPHPDNPFYQPGSTVDLLGGRSTVLKQTNDTATAPHVSFYRSFVYDSLVYLQWLGNNGRLSVELPGNLMITKAFSFNGITGPVESEGITFTDPIEFTIIVPDPGPNITLTFPDDFVWVAAQNRYELAAPVALPPGVYSVTKAGGSIAADTNYMYLPQPGVGTATVVSGQTASISFANEYFTPQPPGSLPGLRVRKIFHGLDITTPPANFQIKIEGPDAVAGVPVLPNDTDSWVLNTTTNRYELVLDLTAATTGTALQNLEVGEYCISEFNYTVAGFDLARVAWAVVELGSGTPVLLPPGQATTVSTPLLTVTIADGDDAVVRIDNYYTLTPTPPIPPPLPWSPLHHAYLIGDDRGLILPTGDITRAEVATILFRLITDDYRAQLWTQQNPFPDVNITDWFNNAVSTMTAAGMFLGRPDGLFAPYDPITRAELVTIMARAAGITYQGDNLFPDIADHWAADCINAMMDAGWIQGDGSGNFHPDHHATRAEAAAIFNRILQRLPQSLDSLLPGMITWPDNMNPNAWYYLYLQEATNSHAHTDTSDGYEIWTELIPPRNWAVLERPDSRPEDILT